MNRPVLVLNANYAPLNVCTTRRAIGLLMTEKAVIVANGRGAVRTPASTYPRPAIIRLGYMIHRPHPRVKLTKQEVFRRDNHTCQYCGRQEGTMTIDHVVPRHLGGGHAWTNLVTACPACNRKKGGRPSQDTQMPLLRPAAEPPATALYLYRRFLPDNRDWLPFVQGW